jgi:hypothetical protein
MLLSHIQHWGSTRVERPFSLVVLSGIVVGTMSWVSQLPAHADVVVRGGSVTVQVGEFDRPRAIYSRDRDWSDRRPRYGDRREIEDSVLINPVLINTSIEDSVLIDPVIVNTPGYNAGYYNNGYHGNSVYSTSETRPTCQVLSNFRAACR